MKNIDYNAYLAGLGDFETNQKNIIKKYLDEQATKDEALKTLYRPEKIDDCYSFIKECVQKKATGNSACVEDAIVFKMARDFFIEILPVVAEDAPEVKPAEVEKVQETVADVAGQIEEDAAEEPVEEKLEIQAVEETPEEAPEEQPTVIPDEVQYDENGNGMLFQF